MLRVSTGKEWTKKYFENQYYNDPIFYNVENLPKHSSTVNILTNKPLRKDHTALSDHHFALYEHNIWNIFTQYERTQNSAEVWFFAADRASPDMANFYFNHQEVLKSFMQYFKERGAPILIPRSDILIATELNLHTQERDDKAQIKQFLDDIGMKYKSKNFSLSMREKECIQYLIMGKTAKEIARLLRISFRTVEFHIKNVKQKTGCKKLGTLLRAMFEKRF
jgi:DNA-binding CsgD family transcriptional regulator